MKKTIQLAILLAALMFMPMVANAFEGEDIIDDIKYYINTDDKTAEVRAKSPKYTGDIVIPETIEYDGVTCYVTSIGEAAFKFCSGLTSVTIPNSVTTIGEWAFSYCEALTSITIPNSVSTIENYVFYRCKSLTSIDIPNSVTYIRYQSFDSCSSLTSITIPSSVTSIGDYAFRACTSLTSIIVESGNPVYDSRDNCNAIIYTANNELFVGCQSTIIPNSVTRIGRLAFDGCIGLTSITIPNSVTSIGSAAFQNCTGLSSITIPNSVTSLGDWPFLGCSGLTSIIVESENTVYDSRNNCNAIIRTTDNELIVGCQNTTIPNSVTSIGEAAFEFCSGLTSVTIPNSVTNIGDLAFCECSDLTSVTIPNSVTSIGVCAFAFCPKLEDVFCFAETVPTIDPYAFYEEGTESYDYIRSATLHVPEGSVSDYENTAPWSKFGTIVGFTLEKCATPTITYANGKVRCTCETEGVTYVYTITPASYTGQSTDGLISLGTSFTVNVKATRDGYTDSDIATTTVNISQVGDMDGDGELTVTDVTSLVNAILGK